MEKMKIICLARSLELGGAERQMLGLAGILGRAGHDVEILAYRPARFYMGLLEDSGVRYSCLNDGRGWFVSIVLGLVRHLKKEKPDYVIAFLPSVCIKAVIAKTLHGGFRLIVSDRNVNVKYRIHDMLRLLAYRKADLVVPNSRAQAEFIRMYAPALASRTHAIVNFVDLEAFPLKAEAQWFRGQDPRTRLVTTARVSRRKNLIGYIRAVSILVKKGYMLDVHWYGLEKENRFHAACMREIERLSLGGVFHIDMAVKDIAKVYHDSDIFVLPSFYEGTSNSMIEAMSCGLPVVVSDVSDNAMYVKPGENGYLLDPHSLDSIVSALESALLLDRLQLCLFGRRSRKIVESISSRKVFADSYLTLIESHSR